MISLLVAYTKTHRVIGAQGKIPWNLSTERNRFKQICKNKYVIMGRKSFEEIGKALSYCTLIIVSKSLKEVTEGCLLAHTLEEAVNIAESQNQKEILIAGGQELYEQSLPLASTIYATEIYTEYEGDKHFPEINKKLWKICDSQSFEENGVKFDYLTYKKSKRKNFLQ